MAFNFTRPVFRTGTQPIMARDMLRGSVTADVGSIASLGSALTTLDVIGAAVGDDVTVHPAVPVAGLVYEAWVTDVDTVTIRLKNYTAGAIDPASQAYRVIVWKARAL